MIDVILFHDGCNICQGINVDLQKDRALQAKALGVTRLPSLVIDGRIMRLEDHSPIEHYA